MNPPPHILLIEDNARIGRFVERGLDAAGYSVEIAVTGRGGLAALRETPPDLVILDLGLPDIDGMEVLATLRGDGHDMPVVILTARGEVPDKIAGFTAGADDYLTKPFAVAELLVRVQARLRPRATTRSTPESLNHGALTLDLHSRVVTAPDIGERELSNREFALLEALMRKPGVTHTREELLERVWGINFDPQSNVVDVYVRYLRLKVGAHRIETVRGGGYRMAEPA